MIPASTKPPKRGGTPHPGARRGDPPVIDPRLTQSVGTVPVRRAHEQSPRPVWVRRRGDQRHRSRSEGRPGRVVDGEPRPSRVDVQAAAGREVAQPAAGERAGVRRRRRQVLLRGRTPRRACSRSPSRRSRASRRPTSTRCASTSRRPTCCSRRTSPSPSRSSSRARCSRRTAISRSGMIGTGPYILKEHTRKVRVVLAAQPGLLRQGPSLRRRVHHPLDARTPPPGWPRSAPARADFIWCRARPRWRSLARPTPTPSCRRTTTRWRRSAWRWPRTGRPSTTCGCGARSRWPSTARSMVDTVFEGHGILGWGVPYIYYQDTTPTAQGPRPVVAVQAGRGEEAPGRGRPRQGLRDDAVLLRVLPADDLAGPARPAGSQEEPQHRRQDHQARLHDLLRALRREQVGRDVVGFQSGHAIGRRRADLPVHALEVARRTSSASTTRSSTS